MTALDKYIQELKLIQSKMNFNEIELIRYIYINLGKKMDFDLNYTFGNRKNKNKIYKKEIDEEELNRIFKIHTAVCKSLAYLQEKILKEFDIDIRTVETEMQTDRIQRKACLQYYQIAKWRRIFI